MKQAQCVICKCGSIIAACTEPQCYQESSWMRDVRIYSKKGYSIEMKDCDDFRFSTCKCIKAGELQFSDTGIHQ